MNCTDCRGKLNDYVDRALPPTEAGAVEAHVAGCPGCRREVEGLRTLLANARALRKEIAPRADLWPALSMEIATGGAAPADAAARSGAFPPRRRPILLHVLPLAMAASVALLFTSLERRHPRPNAGTGWWSVSALSGAPRLDSRTIATDAADLRVGAWLETDAHSTARLSSDQIGRVTVEPNSRLRLSTAAQNDHRLDLARGSLSAFIWAPPRIFFVNTPSATAVDLGCAYTLKVDDDGDGQLHVTLGYVALEHDGRESLIPSGAMCLTRRHAGPGTPFSEDASEALRAALEQFDFRPGSAGTALATILAVARPEDAVTLWHLLARTAGAERARVFDALAQHHAPPQGVTRPGVLAGDTAMRSAWGRELGLGTFGRP